LVETFAIPTGFYTLFGYNIIKHNSIVEPQKCGKLNLLSDAISNAINNVKEK
jgi:hypothetical protein